MTYRDQQLLADIQAAIDAIRSHLNRGDLTDGLVPDAVRIQLPEIGAAAKALPADLLDTPERRDVSSHERHRASRMRDSEYRLAYERAAREIAQTDAVIRELDALRANLGMSKAELARRVNRNASSVRRLFTASQARPELPLIAAIADALGADLRVVRRTA